MALNHGSSGGVDVVDVKYVLSAFEAMNQCSLVVTITVGGTQGRPFLNLEVSAYERPSVDVEPVQLASWKCVAGSTQTKTMEAAILQALYRLDAQLAEKELARADKK